MKDVQIEKSKFDALLKKMLAMRPIQNDDLKLGKPAKKRKPKKSAA